MGQRQQRRGRKDQRDRGADRVGFDCNLSFADVGGLRVLSQLTYPDGATTVSYCYDQFGPGMFGNYTVKTTVTQGTMNTIAVRGDGPTNVTIGEHGTMDHMNMGVNQSGEAVTYGAAHEGGHLLGLPDEYTKVLNDKGDMVGNIVHRGYEKNVMGSTAKHARMRLPMTRLGLLVACLIMSVASDATHAEVTSRIELLSRSAFKIELPTAWRVKRVIDWEDEIYYISDNSGKILLIDFGNNPDITGLRRKSVEVPTLLNGEKALEFRKNGLLSDLIVEPRCGETRYAWLHRIAKDAERVDVVTAAMKSIACVHPRTGVPTRPPSVQPEGHNR